MMVGLISKYHHEYAQIYRVGGMGPNIVGLCCTRAINPKAKCLSEITFRDAGKIEDCYLYRLAHHKNGLALFRHVVMVSSPQDKYVQRHSARLQLEGFRIKEGSTRARATMEMARAILAPVLEKATRWERGETGPAAGGWGVPVATDIAFALALVAVLGDRIPNQVRIALLAFAAIDDVGGVVVIAATYQSDLSWPLLGSAVVLLAAVHLLQRLTMLPAVVSILTGLAAFACVMASGLHPTLAGIALGLTVPADPLIGRRHFLERARALTAELDDVRTRRRRAAQRDEDTTTLLEREDALLGRLEGLTIGTESVLDRLTRNLNPWVSYVVLPLFALANGGLALQPQAFADAFASEAFWAVVAGLALGKPLGIVLLTWLAARFGLVRLPAGMGWGDVAGLGLIAGIGFTVSLFIADLAFGGEARLAEAKMGILTASLAAGAAGAAILAWTHRR